DAGGGAKSTLAASQRPPQDADAPRRPPPQGRLRAPYPVRFGEVGDAYPASKRHTRSGGRCVSGFQAPYPVRFGEGQVWGDKSP
ncbi:MAG: hypothetical protein AAF355_12450, partial [Myxococcota bacterium]